MHINAPLEKNETIRVFCKASLLDFTKKKASLLDIEIELFLK
jgi:hypothetical protein